MGESRRISLSTTGSRPEQDVYRDLVGDGVEE